MGQRAEDPGVGLSSFYDEIWVECPRCRGAARIDWSIHRVTCFGCGYSSSGPPPEALKGAETIHAMWRPRCVGCGGELARRVTNAPRFHDGHALASVRCAGCGRVAEYPVWRVLPRLEDGNDPVFGLPLILRTNIGGEVLWALNLRHLDLLEQWLGATLRERYPGETRMTMMARLPRWMKARENRAAVLDGIARLRAKASAAGIA